jgi:hypothetical protein
MTQFQCHRCKQVILADETISVDGDLTVHLDCRRPRDLSHEERALLFKYCFEHRVADCGRCATSFRPQELASDLVGDRTHLCPICRADLIDAVRAHLYGCAMLPADVRQRAREAREAAQQLIKRSQEIASRADLLMREAEAAVSAAQSTLLPEVRAALALLRQTMFRVARKGG